MKEYKYLLMEPQSLRLHSPVQQTGFRYHEFQKGVTFDSLNKDYNHILFLLEGKMQISCNEFSRRIIRKNDFIFIPISADVKCVTKSSGQIVVFSFDTFADSFNKSYIRSLNIIRHKINYTFSPLPMNEPLKNFIEILFHYITQGLNKPILHEIKHEEFFVVLQSFYTPYEVCQFLYPLIGESIDFRIKVLRKYRRVDHLDDFRCLFNIEPKAFSQQFKEEFGKSPYNWLLSQKAKHIYFSLSETDQSLDEIRKKYGFKFAGHFTRFCKEQFKCAPLQLRKQLKQPGTVI